MLIAQWSTPFRRPAIAVAMASTFAFVIVAMWRFGGGLQPAEFAAYDLFLSLCAGTETAKPPVTIVGATEEDLTTLGWPLADGVLARLLEKLLDEGARVVGVDIYRDRPVEPGSAALASVLGATDRIVWVTKFREGKWQGIAPPDILVGTDRIGFGDVVVDPGGVVRRGLLFLDDGVSVSYSFALRVALRYLRELGIALGPDPETVTHARIGSMTLPPLEPNDGSYVRADARGYQFLLDYAAGADAFPVHSISEVLSGNLPAGSLRDQIVLVGVTSTSVKDLFYTPLNAAPTVSEYVDKPMFGVELHAHAIGQLLAHALDVRQPITSLPEWLELLWIWAWGLTGALCGLLAARPWQTAGAALGGFLALAAICFGAFALRLWLPFVPASLTLIGSGGLVKSYAYYRERLTRAVFSRFMSPALVKELLADPRRVRFGGERREMTFLFTDIAGFTHLVETLGPEAVVPLLNGYLDCVCEAVRRHGGTIDKIVGDAVHAFFGAPLDQPDHALRAIRCSLEIDQIAEDFARRQQAQGIPFGCTRIGVHSGIALVGSFGGRELLDYTAHGDAINTAARLESANKVLGTRVCTSYATVERCPTLRFRPVGTLILAGKAKPIEAFTPVAPGSTPDALLADYAAAFQALENGDPSAASSFAELSRTYPGDPLIALHARRLADGVTDVIIDGIGK
jgi:adenylate cyclase